MLSIRQLLVAGMAWGLVLLNPPLRTSAPKSLPGVSKGNPLLAKESDYKSKEEYYRKTVCFVCKGKTPRTVYAVG